MEKQRRTTKLTIRKILDDDSDTALLAEAKRLMPGCAGLVIALLRNDGDVTVLTGYIDDFITVGILEKAKLQILAGEDLHDV